MGVALGIFVVACLWSSWYKRTHPRKPTCSLVYVPVYLVVKPPPPPPPSDFQQWESQFEGNRS